MVMVFVVMVPISGYMVRRGFAKHGSPAPGRLRFRDANMIGLTSTAWALLGAILTNIVTFAIRTSGYPRLALTLQVLASTLIGLYVILPRQARRLRRLCGADEQTLHAI